MADSPNFSIDLTGQVALVTGTTSGLGRRFAQVLAAAGARVAIAGRRIERLEELAAEIRADGGEAMPVPLDVTDTEALFAAVAHIEEAMGAPIQILVNNAGIPDAKLAMKMEPEFVELMLATNFTSLFHLSCEVARRLKDSDLHGRIVNISSMGAYRAGMGTSMYAITKAAVIRMTEMLSLEFAKFDINVNCIAPGAFESEMMDGMLERMGDITKGFPRARLGKPSQMDSTLLFLVSPSSEFVTGTTVRVHDAQGLQA